MPRKKLSLHAVTKLASQLAGPTDREKHGNSSDDPPWISHVAMLTGVLAALAGVLTVRATSLTNDAIYQSNQAILAQTQSSDAWAEYQADSIKARIVETQLAGSGTGGKEHTDLTDEDDNLRARQPQSKQTATEKAAERDSYMKQGLDRLAEKDLLGYASLAAQLGIALASVAAMVKNRDTFYGAAAVGAAAVAIAAYAFLSHML